jgi:hypothetical protein
VLAQIAVYVIKNISIWNSVVGRRCLLYLTIKPECKMHS